MDKKFNSEMNLVKMIGIVHVVVSHIYASLFSIIRQSYSFHMPLFYFVSGYFYDEKHESEKTKYIWSKFKKDVGLFYFYYFLLIIFCLAFQWKYNISLGNVSIYTLLVQPFTTGEMGFMMGPAWFLLSLFLVQFLFVLIFPIIRIFFKNIYLQFCFFFSLSLISVILNNRTVNINEFVLMMYRTLIGLFFYFLGFFYKNKIENKVNIFNGSILFFCLFIISFLTAKFYPATLFDMRQGIYHNHIFLFFITSLIGIYISIFISKGLDKILKKNDFLHLVGKNSFYIMIFHFFVNFFVSFILLKVNFVNPNEWGPILVNSGIRPYEINNLWFVYISLGIILPTLYGLLIEKLKTRINENQSFAIK